MKNLTSFLPAFLGIFIVVQAGLNRKVASQWGLSGAVFFNSLVLFVGAGVFLALILSKPNLFPAEFTPHLDLKTFATWFVLPGLLGLALVLGGPWAIARWGAVHTFILVISAQLAMSLIWDWQVEGISASKQRLCGVVIAWAGAILACRAL